MIQVLLEGGCGACNCTTDFFTVLNATATCEWAVGIFSAYNDERAFGVERACYAEEVVGYGFGRVAAPCEAETAWRVVVVVTLVLPEPEVETNVIHFGVCEDEGWTSMDER